MDAKNWVLTRSRHFNPNLTAYTGLEALGIDIIQNEVIKNSIVDVYNTEYERVEGSVRNHLRNIYDYGRPIIRTHFNTEVYEDSNYSGTIYRPVNFDQLARNPEYRNALIVLKQDNLRYGRLLNIAREKVEELIGRISAYIK